MRLKAIRSSLNITVGQIYEGQLTEYKHSSGFGEGWHVLVFNNIGNWYEYHICIFEPA